MELINGHPNEEANELQLVRPVSATLMSSNGYKTPEELRLIPTAPGTDSHKTFPHYEFNDTLDEVLGYRKLSVTQTTIAPSAKKRTRLLPRQAPRRRIPGGHLVIGARHSNSKRFAVRITLGANVTVCDNGMLLGDFMADGRKHTKNMSLRDYLRRSRSTTRNATSTRSQGHRALAGTPALRKRVWQRSARGSRLRKTDRKEGTRVYDDRAEALSLPIDHFCARPTGAESARKP